MSANVSLSNNREYHDAIDNDIDSPKLDNSGRL